MLVATLRRGTPTLTLAITLPDTPTPALTGTPTLPHTDTPALTTLTSQALKGVYSYDTTSLIPVYY